MEASSGVLAVPFSPSSPVHSSTADRIMVRGLLLAAPISFVINGRRCLKSWFLSRCKMMLLGVIVEQESLAAKLKEKKIEGACFKGDLVILRGY